MKLLESFFIKQNSWIVFLTMIIVIPIFLFLIGFKNLSFHEETGNTVTSMTITHPFNTIIIYGFLSSWLFTLTNFCYKKTNNPNKQQLKRFKTFLVLFLLVLTTENSIMYHYADRIFHSHSDEYFYLFAIPTFFYLCSTWIAFRIINNYLNQTNNNHLLFPYNFLNAALFPLSVWKLHNNLSNLDNHTDQQDRL